MIRRFLTPALTCALLGTASLAMADTMIKDVDVSLDMSAIQNPKAAEHLTTVAGDLKEAIVARLTDKIAPEGSDGAKISVDIDEVELASTLDAVHGLAESKLVGKVAITSETDNSAFDAFDLAVSFDQAVIYLPEGTDPTLLTIDSPLYYHSMVEAFAQAVADKID
ncbi:hypothetical protein [Phaeovulum sp.]|uniref:hypothetical protein n=1 Tax=Phaeovulum sp. TaxID=2934796 RepID=UPI0039E3C31D